MAIAAALSAAVVQNIQCYIAVCWFLAAAQAMESYIAVCVFVAVAASKQKAAPPGKAVQPENSSEKKDQEWSTEKAAHRCDPALTPQPRKIKPYRNPVATSHNHTRKWFEFVAIAGMLLLERCPPLHDDLRKHAQQTATEWGFTEDSPNASWPFLARHFGESSRHISRSAATQPLVPPPITDDGHSALGEPPTDPLAAEDTESPPAAGEAPPDSEGVLPAPEQPIKEVVDPTANDATLTDEISPPSLFKFFQKGDYQAPRLRALFPGMDPCAPTIRALDKRLNAILECSEHQSIIAMRLFKECGQVVNIDMQKHMVRFQTDLWKKKVNPWLQEATKNRVSVKSSLRTLAQHWLEETKLIVASALAPPPAASSSCGQASASSGQCHAVVDSPAAQQDEAKPAFSPHKAAPSDQAPREFVDLDKWLPRQTHAHRRRH